MIKTEWHGVIWEAYLEEDPEGFVGYGQSKDEAIDNLKDQLEGNDETF